ncbi:TrmH family RNA methyltransferase [Patescibacteria group bacterium]|nr:MAG: TrmH family RNA methyltransferase [Patescibacteria group bacterium]
MFLIAHDIRSLHNVGSIFRSADAFGVEKLYLTGYTGTPPRNEIAKTALGSQDRMPWEKREDVLALIVELKGKGMTVVALDNREGAVDLSVFARTLSLSKGTKQSPGLALILGSEVEGVPKEVVAACDATVEIPLPGAKRSLNVAVATGVALFVLGRKIG